MRIDAHEVTPRAGASVLDAARDLSIEIPTLCHHPALPPDDSCRMCLVEIEGRTGLHPACVLPATDDLVVRTESPAVRAARRHVLRLLLAHYRPGVGKERNELLELARRHGVRAPAGWSGAPSGVDESNPFIRVDHGACIRCWRCVRACDLLNGVTAIGVGCRLGLRVADGRIVGTSPDWDGPANHGLLGVKGRFGWAQRSCATS
jgi:predicted molibdopterin-dependent oxidoreductase YjgC